MAAAKQAVVDAQAAYDQAVQALKVAQTTEDSDAVTYQQLQQVADVAKQVLVAAQAKLDQLLQTKALNDAIDRTNQETSQSKSAQGESMTNTEHDMTNGGGTTLNTKYALGTEHATTGGDTVTLKAHRALSAEQATTLQQRKAAMAAATTKSTSTLPQTNEKADRTVSVLGLMVIGLVGLLGVTKRRKRI
ncbi:LPXTG cell wall anchor domain-containing protein [Lactiplantibacillus plantarum]|uniref:LPXTG cell wall anchor domain-containing protein n=1 Tax=Lactiplantibacillus plantarum TaxID=1590 RepID=UPI001FF0DB13|nr:LPXTG cell wall anchor domain-containing protein [Lactiplantibacillus plantarum]